MKIHDAIEFLDKQIPDASSGLPEEVFLFVSRMTPLVNVDLLIKDEKGRTLLSWRDDLHGTAWHIPGGIVRFKEKSEDRIKKVAQREIGAIVRFDPLPMAINQIICSRKTRGHFVSLLYKCFLSSKFIPRNKGLREGDQGYLKWHKSCPENLISTHKRLYRKYI